MFDAKVIQVIVTTLELRGTGKQEDPCRRVTQYWSLDGKLLVEHDPAPPVVFKLAKEEVIRD